MKMQKEDIFNQNTNFELKLYAKRWGLAILLALDSLILRILKNSFGIINDVYAEYFQVSHLAVDWFTLVQVPGMILSSAILAPTIFNQVVGLRNLTLAMAGGLFFACVCLLIAYVFPVLYPLIFVGEFIVGFVVITMDVVAASFAIKWFPEHQIGLALSIKLISGNIGSLLAYLIPTNLFISPVKHNTSIYANYSTFLNETSESKLWLATNQFRFIAFSSSLVLFSFIVLLFFVLTAVDVPPKPPTLAQATVRVSENLNDSGIVDIFINIKEFYYECKRILGNKLIIQTAVIFAITQGCNFIQKLFMSEILRKIFSRLKHPLQANTLSGYVLVLFELGCILGSVVSGKVVDCCKNYHTQILINLLLCFVSVVGIFFGYIYCNAVLIFISNTLFGFFVTFLVTPIFEIVYQHMFPIDTGFLTLMLRIECSIGIIVISQFCRLLLDLFGGTGVLAFLSALLFMGFIISLFVKPSYKRLDLSNKSTADPDEKTSLIK